MRPAWRSVWTAQFLAVSEGARVSAGLRRLCVVHDFRIERVCPMMIRSVMGTPCLLSGA